MDEQKRQTELEGALYVEEEEDEDEEFDDELDDDDDDDEDDDEDSDADDDLDAALDEDDDDDDGSYSTDDGKAEKALEFLEQVFDRMGLDVDVELRRNGKQIELDVQGADAGRAIGRKGQTLEALQFLVNKVVNRFPEGRRYVVVDSGDYRERHDGSLIAMARRQAKRAVQMGKVITLEPMPPRDRRVVHLSLTKFPGVRTQSNGQGVERRIQIVPSKLSRRVKEDRLRSRDDDEPSGPLDDLE